MFTPILGFVRFSIFKLGACIRQVDIETDRKARRVMWPIRTAAWCNYL